MSEAPGPPAAPPARASGPDVPEVPEACEALDAPRAPSPPGRVRWALRLGGAALTLVAAVSGATVVGRTVVRARPLQVHGIEVRGLSRTGRDTLMQAAGLRLHRPLLTIDLPASVRAIEALPWVQHATVRRQLPDRLRVEVQEHVAKAAAMVGELWLVNPAGEPFKRFTSDDALVLPVITGVHAQPSAEKALHQQPAVVGRLQDGLALLDALLEVRDDLYNVDELHFDADLGWSGVLLLGRNHAGGAAPRPAVSVHLGHAPKARLPVLVYALERLAERREVPEVIWAAHVHQEGRVQVRLASAAACLGGPPSPKLVGAKESGKREPWHRSRSSSSASTSAPAKSAPSSAR